MRAALGAALFIRPSLLLLDEPTNHLDLHALVWLENWLLHNFDGMCIVVSHDSYFLNNICTDIIELRSILAGQKKNSLEQYNGDYNTFKTTVEERKIAQTRARIAYEKEKEKLQEFISREGRKYDNPAHQAQRRMKIKQLEKLVEIEDIEEDSDVTIKLPSPYCVFDSNSTLIQIQNISFGWTNEAKDLLFSNVDFSISSHARIVILGKNGCGKTSLLNVLTGEKEASSGEKFLEGGDEKVIVTFISFM
jgi:ATPase subunit of ABC transporter with duplicated ATPase domains